MVLLASKVSSIEGLMISDSSVRQEVKKIPLKRIKERVSLSSFILIRLKAFLGAIRKVNNRAGKNPDNCPIFFAIYFSTFI